MIRSTLNIPAASNLSSATKNALSAAFEAQGATDDEILVLLQTKFVEDAIAKQRGQILVDCDGILDVPFAGWTYEEEQLPNLLEGKIDIRQLDRFVTPAQNAGWAKIAVMEEQLKSKLLVPVQVMFWLYRPENQHLIPESWKQGYTIFLTKFRSADDSPVVAYLCWFVRRWYVRDYLIDGGFSASVRVAVLASLPSKT